MAARATVSQLELDHAEHNVSVLSDQVKAQGRTVNVRADMWMRPEIRSIELVVDLEFEELQEVVPSSSNATWFMSEPPFRELDDKPRSTRLNEALIMAAEMIEDAARESQDAEFEKIVETLRRVAN